MEYSTLIFEMREHVAYVTLNRPEAFNALNMQMARELMEVALRCDEDAAARVVVVTGAGRAFCGGGDLKGFAATGDGLPAHAKELTTYLHNAISLFARMEKPVIAAVNGVAAGAGMSLSCACDLVLAAASARFTMAYTRAGLTPDGSSTYFLPRLVGLHRALELTLTNRTLSAQEAMEWGIVTRVVGDAEIMTETHALAEQLAEGPTRTFGAAKRLLQSGLTETLETQMSIESRAIAEITRTADGREGVLAFTEKRAPRFKGE